jgi:multidrug efflux pump subunit AcrB
MWIVRIALNRPYTFIVLALVILLLSPIVILRTPTDIFPSIDIPVVAPIFSYTGLDPEQMEERIVWPFERSVTTTVNDIEHIESTSASGRSIVKIFFQPGANIDSATAQVSAISQPIVHNMPPGTNPPFIITYNASSVPIVQLALSSDTLTEQSLFDLGINFIRVQMVTIPGALVPYPYGGKQKQVMVDLDSAQLQSKGLSATDIVNTVATQNLILPAGTSKIGSFEYAVDLNGSPARVEEMNDFPVKVVNNSTIYLRDVAHVRDGFAPQTNVVRQEGRRGVLISILKSGKASTLSVIDGVRETLKKLAPTLPAELKMQLLADQSLFVRGAVNSVVREAIVAGCLTGIMILIFLGSWRSTLIIAVSIPLSVLTSIMVLSALHETINIMTLGGLALAVGILVDDATVTIENIERYLEQGQALNEAILEGAAQIAVPALVSTLCICIVFLPMFFLSGVAKFLFVPLAEAVVFAMLASYVLSRTLVPTLAMYLLKLHDGHAPSRNPLVLGQRLFQRGFEWVRSLYKDVLTALFASRWIFVPLFLLVCASAILLVPWLGQDFFPYTDTGQLKLHLRARTGMRVEETARLCDLVEDSIRQIIPKEELASMLDNIGLPYSGINMTYSNSAPIGTSDADILISLSERHRPSAEYVRAIRSRLANDFPGVAFYFLSADIVSQILDFGLPAPINVQLIGRDIEGNRQAADRMLERFKRIPGLADLRIQEPFDLPELHVNVDRTKAAGVGFTQSDVANDLIVALSGSFQTQPTFWLNPVNGVTYNITTQTPQYQAQSLQDLRNVPLTSPSGSGRSAILGDLASIERGSGMGIVDHYNIQRVVNIYGAVDGRDLGGAGVDVERIVNEQRKSLPKGTEAVIRGRLETMRQSFTGLLAGLGFAIVLVYLLIVVNFQSWLDPFIIIMALPAALAGIVVFLFLTGTTISVPALMGAIMCMGVATANSILVVSFAKERLLHHGDPVEAALEAGFTRFRPVIMTAAAMIMGMIPMSLGLGEGGEQNAPLGRAVIGGLLCATVATLFFVPTVFSILHRPRKQVPA